MPSRSSKGSLFEAFAVAHLGARQAFGLDEYAPECERMLEYIGLRNQELSRLSVKDLMSVRDFGSPATIHARLQILRDDHWIELEGTDDGRRKQVVLSMTSEAYFNELGKKLIEIVKTSR
jgi:hypothetical protein